MRDIWSGVIVSENFLHSNRIYQWRAKKINSRFSSCHQIASDCLRFLVQLFGIQQSGIYIHSPSYISIVLAETSNTFSYLCTEYYSIEISDSSVARWIHVNTLVSIHLSQTNPPSLSSECIDFPSLPKIPSERSTLASRRIKRRGEKKKGRKEEKSEEKTVTQKKIRLRSRPGPLLALCFA